MGVLQIISELLFLFVMRQVSLFAGLQDRADLARYFLVSFFCNM